MSGYVPVRALIEVPRGGFVKRELHATPGAPPRTAPVDFVSPLPCPFNYGYAVGTLADDGDPVDVVVLGPRLLRGQQVTRLAVAEVRFQDRGKSDLKWILSDHPLTTTERHAIAAFFRFYAMARRLLDRVRGRPGDTRFLGVAPYGA